MYDVSDVCCSLPHGKNTAKCQPLYEEFIYVRCKQIQGVSDNSSGSVL